MKFSLLINHIKSKQTKLTSCWLLEKKIKVGLGNFINNQDREEVGKVNLKTNTA